MSIVYEIAGGSLFSSGSAIEPEFSDELELSLQAVKKVEKRMKVIKNLFIFLKVCKNSLKAKSLRPKA